MCILVEVEVGGHLNSDHLIFPLNVSNGGHCVVVVVFCWSGFKNSYKGQGEGLTNFEGKRVPPSLRASRTKS